MKAITIKKNLHKVIDNIEDESILKAVFKLLSSSSTESKQYELTPSQQAIVEERLSSYEKGQSVTTSWETAKTNARKAFIKK